MEAGGELKYQETVRSVRLLGSRFFQDLQNKGSAGNGKLGERNKVYDVHMTADEEEDQEVHFAGTSEEEPSDEDILIYFLEFQDEDAIYISEFEDHIVEAVQESTLAPVYASYQEARMRLREKAKARGFFSSSSKGRGKSKGKKGGKNTSSFWDAQRRRPLAERIANSSCKLCGQKGHWRRECPRREELKTETTHFPPMDEINDLPEIVETIPDDAILYFEEDDTETQASRKCLEGRGESQRINSQEWCFTVSPKVMHALPFSTALARKLLTFDRTTRTAKSTLRRLSTDAGKQLRCFTQLKFLRRQPFASTSTLCEIINLMQLPPI